MTKHRFHIVYKNVERLLSSHAIYQTQEKHFRLYRIKRYLPQRTKQYKYKKNKKQRNRKPVIFTTKATRWIKFKMNINYMYKIGIGVIETVKIQFIINISTSETT